MYFIVLFERLISFLLEVRETFMNMSHTLKGINGITHLSPKPFKTMYAPAMNETLKVIGFQEVN